MFDCIHKNKILQYVLALVFGFFFGFLLQKGAVAYYEMILRQLLLVDFTVIKVMLTAIITGMIGVYAMHGLGWVRLHKKSGSVGTNIPGPLIFGIGFGLLGYCPGTAVAAVGHGALDALLGGVVGMIIGSALYAQAYPVLKQKILGIGSFKDKTFIDLFGVRNPWYVIIPAVLIGLIALIIIETAGL